MVSPWFQPDGFLPSGPHRVELMGGPRDGERPILRRTETTIPTGHWAGGVEIVGTYVPRDDHPHRLFWEVDSGEG